MKRLFSLIGTFVLISSCETENKQNTLLHINRVNKLELLTVDEKCGEWGGDEKQLTIYRDDFKGPLLADYLERTKNCDNGSEPKVTKSIKRIEITEEESKLIVESINELCESKLAKEDYPSNSGIFNRIMLSDSSMIITDFPSVELKKFAKLVGKIKQK
jgi:hypothetical protein